MSTDWRRWLSKKTSTEPRVAVRFFDRPVPVSARDEVQLIYLGVRIIVKKKQKIGLFCGRLVLRTFQNLKCILHGDQRLVFAVAYLF
ncbi:hypothetical protein CEXT_675021 [Caerostris extrusa]|uniref:Uncharacterized protein n=1 Tax=Caerostris extrusa TaxID=172846 RepID=A0AAV4S1I6_CAEEX|nr:hypothetical protein CEXT_675021 [Caerostris extrusa]